MVWKAYVFVRFENNWFKHNIKVYKYEYMKIWIWNKKKTYLFDTLIVYQNTKWSKCKNIKIKKNKNILPQKYKNIKI